MKNKSDQFVQRLFESQEISPALRASYQAEIDNLQSPRLTWRTALPGTLLLGILLVGIAAIVRNLFVVEARPHVIASWRVMGGTSIWVAYLISRDLVRRKHSTTAVSSISQAFFCASALMTVASLLAGAGDPTNPASTFHTMFVFVFYFTCAAWVTNNRIAAAELAAREQMLRIECRLADLAERSAGTR